jgi:hypothetical protein
MRKEKLENFLTRWEQIFIIVNCVKQLNNAFDKRAAQMERCLSWLKEHAWKACIRCKAYRGFESLSLRHN